MKSYIEIFKSALISNSQSYAINLKRNYNFRIDYDNYYNKKTDDLNEIVIPPEVNQVYFGQINQPLESLHQLFKKHPNITKLKTLNEYPYEVPTTDLGTIPNQIKDLSISFQRDVTFLPGYFHEGLESLMFTLTGSKLTFGNGSLPSTLKHLHTKRMTEKFEANLVNFEIESLPPNIETLYLSSGLGSFRITNCSYPLSMLREVRTTMKWLLRMKGLLPSLTTIYLLSEYQLELQAGDLPNSVTFIDFGNNYYRIDPSIIPPNIKHLNLTQCVYNLKSSATIPPFFSNDMDLDYLNLGKNLQLDGSKLDASLLPSRIKELVITQLAAHQIQSLPEGIEQLTVSTLIEIDRWIPKSVRELSIDCSNYLKSIESLINLPKSIEAITFLYFKTLDEDEIMKLPSTVKTLSFTGIDYSIDRKFIDKFIPKTVTTMYFYNKSIQLRRIDINHFLFSINSSVNGIFNVGIINIHNWKFNKKNIGLF